MKRQVIFFFTLCLLVTVYIGGCENNYPNSIWGPPYNDKPDPTISAAEKALGTFAGIGEISITGTNFSTIAEENRVFLGGERATLLETSTTLLKIRPPNVSGDSLRLQVDVIGALDYAEFYPFQIGQAVVEFGGFSDQDDAFAIAFDADSSLYVSILLDNTGQKKKIVKIGPGGEWETYATTLTDKASAMKFGPGGYLYYLNIVGFILRSDPGGDDNELNDLFAIVPKGVFDLDFDANANLYCGGVGSEVYRLDANASPLASSTVVATYDSISIRSVRVFNDGAADYLYVAGSFFGSRTSVVQEGVWRHEILSATGDLGDSELILDWHNLYPQADILSLNFAADGDMYLGTNSSQGIIIRHPDGSTDPLYEGVLEPDTYTFVWGNDEFGYINRRNSDLSKQRILKINMLKAGAPYYGQQ